MLKPFALLLILMLMLSTISCKNETRETTKVETEIKAVDTVQKPPVKRAPKKDLTPEDIAMVQSVMARVMAEPNLKKYASYLVSAEMVTLLAEEKGPFTVFAPSNMALESLTAEQKKFYSIPENKPKLKEMLKSYILKGKLDKESLSQTIAKNGKTRLKTLSGVTLTASKSGEDIIISDKKGTEAKVVKGSIDGSNGVVYVVDGLLKVH